MGNEIVPISERAGTVDVAMSRAAQEVQAAMTIAKRFPRDETASYNRVVQACKRKTLAEVAMYAYPKGGTTVTGPSIRLAEAIAQNWGNLDCGVIELEQRNGESTVLAYAMDLETNTRQTKVFQVRHERHTKSGSYKLNDPRDIYELVANQGARRLRACILGVIPGDVIDAAVDECERTLKNSNGEPLVDRVRKMVVVFSDLGVTQEMIEKRLGHKIEATVEAEFVALRKIYQSIKDGMADRTQFFEVTQPVDDGKSKADKLADEIASKPASAPANGGAGNLPRGPSCKAEWDAVQKFAKAYGSQEIQKARSECGYGDLALEACNARQLGEIFSKLSDWEISGKFAQKEPTSATKGKKDLGF